MYHPVPVWLLWLKHPQRLDFIALTVGSVIPDLLEPVFIIWFPELYWTSREWSHSLLGALTYDLALAFAATVVVARPLLAFLDRYRPSPLWNRFGGRVYRVPKSGMVTLASAAIGTLSHILIDLPFHTVTTILYPGPRIRLLPESYSDLLGWSSALIFGPAFGFLLYAYWWRPSRTETEGRSETSD